MHHDELDNLRRCMDRLLWYLYFWVLTFLCDKFKLIKWLLRDILQEDLHAFVRLLDVAEEFLRMRPSLGARSGGHIVLDFLPVLPKKLKSFKESHMLHQRPSTVLRATDLHLLTFMFLLLVPLPIRPDDWGRLVYRDTRIHWRLPLAFSRWWNFYVFHLILWWQHLGNIGLTWSHPIFSCFALPPLHALQVLWCLRFTSASLQSQLFLLLIAHLINNWGRLQALRDALLFREVFLKQAFSILGWLIFGEVMRHHYFWLNYYIILKTSSSSTCSTQKKVHTNQSHTWMWAMREEVLKST